MKDSKIEITDYNLFRCDKDGKGGGSLMYIHNYLQIVSRQEVDDIGFQEAVWEII